MLFSSSGLPLPARLALPILVTALLAACGGSGEWQTLNVTASAYTLAEEETKKGNVGLTAWGDRLKPGARAIAVSRDLIKKGLTHETQVKIEGLRGTYTVRDKMNKRWKNKIDILFKDKAMAREWGKQEVAVRWRPPRDS